MPTFDIVLDGAAWHFKISGRMQVYDRTYGMTCHMCSMVIGSEILSLPLGSLITLNMLQSQCTTLSHTYCRDIGATK